MNNLKLILMLAAMLGLCVACYDDKGNYDYKNLGKVDMQLNSGAIIRSFGDLLEIEPEITVSDEETMKNLSYKWELEGDLLSTERKLVWKIDRYPETNGYNLILTITDNSTKLEYRTAYALTVEGKYEGMGVFMIAQNGVGGNSDVHMIKQVYELNDKGEEESTYAIRENIFSLENEGMTLPPSTFKMHMHYAKEILSDGNEDYRSRLTFVSDHEIISVEPASFRIEEESNLANMFDGNIPAGLQEGIGDIYFAHHLDLITDKKGHLYSRIKTNEEEFEFDKFLSEPMAYYNPVTDEDEVLSGIKLLPAGLNTQSCLLHDTDKKRLFIVWDTEYSEPEWGGDGYVIGKLDLVSSSMASSWPEGAPTIEEAFQDYEVIYFAACRQGHTSTTGRYFAVLKDENGKLYHYEFQLAKDFMTTKVSLSLLTYAEMPADLAALFDNPENEIVTLKLYNITYQQTGWLTFIASGNSLYVYNREAKLTENEYLRLVETFDAPIAKMACIDSNMWPEWMGIAFEDGSFEIISMENAKYNTWDGHVWKSEGVDLGHAVDLHFEAGVDLQW